MKGKYDDIISLSRPVSATRVKMSAWDRAAQFSPFAALTGYEAAVTEAGRLTDAREEASDSRSAELDQVLRSVLEVLEEGPRVRLIRFIPDKSKVGGRYTTQIHRIRKVDLHCREFYTEDGLRIPMDDIWEMELL